MHAQIGFVERPQCLIVEIGLALLAHSNLPRSIGNDTFKSLA